MLGVDAADSGANKARELMKRPEPPSAGAPMRSFDPAQEPMQNTYKLMIGSIVPRPIAFVSTIDAQGVRNLAPFSYFTAVSANPPVVVFCPTFRAPDEQRGIANTKDTLRNIIATREFVINIVSEDFAEQMNQCAAQVRPEIDEFELSGLTPIASEIVKPPRVGESRVHMECRLKQVIQVSDKPGGGSVVLGEVLRFHVREDLLDDYRIDPAKLRAIGRMGGSTYVRTQDRFDLSRPK
jgi:flavin reductase (DIM6/NTAB) family NADH-FMN oxidoreductase RutF